MEGPYCVLDDVETPSDNFPELANPNGFNYTRNQQEFEAVMVYYHIDLASRRVESLGYNEPALKTFSADPHGLDGADQSHYISSQNYVAFGEGGVDDAEDADIIWHEYAHSIQENLGAGNMSYSGETMSVQEGSSDYWAVSYSRSVSSYNWGLWANWDGHNPFWAGRRADLDWVYPDDYVTGHDGGQIWSSSLMKIWGDLGRDITDKLFLETHFLWGSSPTMEDAAEAFIQADIQLYNGSHYCTIVNHFRTHGLTNRFVTLSDANSTIQGPSVVCSAATLFSINNLPPDVAISWNCSNNINRLSNQGTNPCNFGAIGSGTGWIEATLTSTINNCVTPFTLPRKTVWVGQPDYILHVYPLTTNNYGEPTACPYTDYEFYIDNNGAPCNGHDPVWTVPSTWTINYSYGNTISINTNNDPANFIYVDFEDCCSEDAYASLYLEDGSPCGDFFLALSPNPTSGETILTIESASEKTTFDDSALWELEIYSQTLELKKKETKLKGKEHKIQTAGWKEGVYLVRVKYNDKILTGKLVVKK